MPSVAAAFSLFWLIPAVISSMLAVVSSTLAACSVAACDRLCDAPLICMDALLSWDADSTTVETVSLSRPSALLSASPILPTSSRPRTVTRWSRRPWASPVSTLTVSLSGPATALTMNWTTTNVISTATTIRMIMTRRAVEYASAESWMDVLAAASSLAIRLSTAVLIASAMGFTWSLITLLNWVRLPATASGRSFSASSFWYDVQFAVNDCWSGSSLAVAANDVHTWFMVVTEVSSRSSAASIAVPLADIATLRSANRTSR